MTRDELQQHLRTAVIAIHEVNTEHLGAAVEVHDAIVGMVNASDSLLADVAHVRKRTIEGIRNRGRRARREGTEAVRSFVRFARFCMFVIACAEAVAIAEAS